MEVKFYDNVDDELLKFAVIISKASGKWVFCKHKERDTYEVPGGHREANESIIDAARRELYEETGALTYSITPISFYSFTEKNQVNGKEEETFGMLYYAQIETFEKELHSEIEKIVFLDEQPTELTYPLIQPKLIAKVMEINSL